MSRRRKCQPHVGYTKQGNPVLYRRSEEARKKVGLNSSIFINYPLHHLLMNNGIWEPSKHKSRFSRIV